MIILAIKFCRHDELKEEPAGHSEYKPDLSTRREHNAQRSYIGHAQRSNFERPRLNVETKALKGGVTTSRATSGAGRNDRNTSGQRENKFNTSYRDISVVVSESNSVVKPKCEQYTSLNKM